MLFVNLLLLRFAGFYYRYPMKIQVNGQSYETPDGTTVRELVARHNLTPEKVAVELNRRLLKTEKYDQVLKEGDEVEIVTFVGGG